MTKQQFNGIKVNVITGFLGVGKTTSIIHLLKHKPKNENWAVLVNEFGQVGLDAQLISQNLSSNNAVSSSEDNSSQQITIKEIPGGCMCCSAGLPMSVALNQLIKQAKPDRILIEPTGLGHPKEVLKVLSGDSYKGVLDIESTLTILNAPHFMDERYYKNTTFMQQLDVADVFVINKSDLASESEIQAVNDYFETHGFTSQSVIQVKQGEIPLSYLTVLPLVEQQADLNTKTPELLFSFVKNNNGASIRNDKSSSSDVRQEQFATHERLMHEDAEYISCGWVFQSGLLFNYDALLSFVPEIRSKQAFKDCMRLKGLLNTDKGMCEINTTNDVLSVQESTGETIKQSVIEVIFKQTSGQAAKESLSVFETQLLACLIA